MAESVPRCGEPPEPLHLLRSTRKIDWTYRMETTRRSLAKAASYRILSTIVTVTVAWMVTGSMSFAATIGVTDALVKLTLYYAHERVWNRIPGGRVEPPEYQI